MSIQVPIESIAFGIRYGPHFRIKDSMGAIVDQILRGNGSPFDPDMFPQSQQGVDTHTLLNEENEDRLRISSTDILLVKELKTGGTEEIEELATHFMSYAVEPVRALGNVDIVHRYGCLIRLEECFNQLQRPLTQNYLGEDTKARDMQLRFTLPLPTYAGLWKPGVNDRVHVIYTVNQTYKPKKADKVEARISMDYQNYFDPALNAADFKRKTFDSLVSAATRYFNDTFAEWLKPLIREAA